MDLACAADITNLAEVFDFAKDYLGLLKAAVIASGIVPPGVEGSGQSLADLLARVVGAEVPKDRPIDGVDQLDFFLGACLFVLPIYAPPLAAMLWCIPVVVAGSVASSAIG